MATSVMLQAEGLMLVLLVHVHTLPREVTLLIAANMVPLVSWIRLVLVYDRLQ